MPGAYQLVQISDVHLTVDGTLKQGVRPRDNLLGVLATLEARGIRPDVFVLSGDLTDAGDPSCYEDLAAIMAKAATESGAGSGAGSGADVLYLPGNHDNRDAFRRGLVPGAGSGMAGAPGDPVDQVRWRGGLRVIALDSTVPGQPHGELGDQSLAFLKSELATPAPDGTVVVLHHPPVPSPVQPLAAIALRDPARLREAIEGTDVRLVLAGHYHHEVAGTLGSVPVWVGPATSYRIDPTVPDTFHGVPGTAVSRIDISEDGPVITVIHSDAVTA
jgi:3',5'-cyclic AMP phosphodiesterase CpdA